MTGPVNNNTVRPTAQVRTNEQVRNDPKVVAPDELKGKTQQEQDQLVAARAETLAAKKPDGTFDFTNNTTSSAQALDPAGPALQRGTNSAEAAALQQQLNLNGANPPLTVDGRFGKKTEQALRAYQKANGLPEDGKAGKDTINSMKANDAISRMNQFGGRTDAESQAKYAQAKTDAEKAMGELNASGKQSPEAKAAMEAKMAEAVKKNDATAGPAPIDTSKPLVDQANQAATNANNAGNAAAKQQALNQGKEALDKAKAEAAKLPAGPEKDAANAQIRQAETNLNNAAATAAKDAGNKAQTAAADAKAAAQAAAAKQAEATAAATGPQTEQSAARAAQLQKEATELKATADAKQKAAEQAISDAQALANNPLTPKDAKDFANNNIRNAQTELSAAKTLNNVTAPPNAQPSEDAKKKMEDAIAAAKGINALDTGLFSNADNQNEVGKKLAEGILAQPGTLPDGSVKSMMDQVGGRNAGDVASGLVLALGKEGLAKLSPADRQALRDAIGWFKGNTNQSRAARLLDNFGK